MIWKTGMSRQTDKPRTEHRAVMSSGYRCSNRKWTTVDGCKTICRNMYLVWRWRLKTAATSDFTQLLKTALSFVGWQEGHPACKRNWMLVCWWWWFDCSFARLIAPVVTTISIILCFNKHRLNQVHLENGRQNGEREFCNSVSCSSYNGNILVSVNPGPPGKMAIIMEREGEGEGGREGELLFNVSSNLLTNCLLQVRSQMRWTFGLVTVVLLRHVSWQWLLCTVVKF